MSTVIVFGPTGQVGSATALTAAKNGAEVWLAMRDTSKQVPGVTKELEESGKFRRVHADLTVPSSVRAAVKSSGAKRAFIYLVHGAENHLRDSIKALKEAGIEFVVFLSSFTILVDRHPRDIDSADILPHIHGQVEANLEETFGIDGFIAVRPGCFVTNIMSEADGIKHGNVKLYGGDFEQDNVVPSDIGAVAGTILATGPRDGQQIVYVYGPEVLTIRDSIQNISKTLGRDCSISDLTEKEGYAKFLSHGLPEHYAKYMTKVLSTAGPDKGKGERFPQYAEGVSNVELYTGKPAMSLEQWVADNRSLFV